MRALVEIERPDDYLYEGWGQIARALGAGVRTAQRRAREQGLGVERLCGRVQCTHGEIKRWKRENTRPLYDCRKSA